MFFLWGKAAWRLALSTTPSALYSEFQAAYEKTKKALKAYREQLAKRAGPYAGTPESSEQHAPAKNYYHKWQTWVVPQLVWSDPATQINALIGDAGGDEFELELTLNRWVVDTRQRELLARGPATDMQYNFGVLYVSSEPIPGARPIEGVGSDWRPSDPASGAPEPRVPWRPKGYRIPQERYFEDALATQRDDIRLQGHIWVRDRSDIEKEGKAGGWDLEVIASYASDQQLEYLGRPEVPEISRDEIVGVEIFVPEYHIPEDNPWGVEASPGPTKGYNGTIFTLLVNRGFGADIQRGDIDVKALSKKGADKFPRVPRPYRGSERGPYVVFGQCFVGSSSLPFGVLTACEKQIRELDEDVRIRQGMQRNFKRIGIIAAGSEKEVELIRQGQHDCLYKISGISKDDVIPLEIGGASDQAVAHEQLSQNDLESVLGFTEQSSGKVTGRGTATEQNIANNGSENRFSTLRLAFEDGVRDYLWRVGYALYEDNRMAQQLNQKDVAELARRGMVDPDAKGAMFLGGARGRTDRIPYHALSVDVRPGMGRQSQAERTESALLQLEVVERLANDAAMNPRFPWDRVARMLAGPLQFPELAEMFENPDEIAAGAAEMQMLLQGGGAQGAQQGGSKIQPKAAAFGGGSGGGAKPQTQRQAQEPSTPKANKSQSQGGASARPKPKKVG